VLHSSDDPGRARSERRDVQMDEEDFAAWKRAQFEQALRLRQDIDRHRIKLERLGVLVAAKHGQDAPVASIFADGAPRGSGAPPSPVRREAAIEDAPTGEPGNAEGSPEEARSPGPPAAVDHGPAAFVQAAVLENSRQHALAHAHQVPASLSAAVEVSCVLMCGGFRRERVVRRLCFWLFKNMAWKLLHALSILVNTISIAYGANDTKNFELDRFEMPRSLWIDFMCSSLLFLEVAVGCIAIGFVGAHSTWLRCSGYHQLDFAVLLTSAANLSISFVFGSRESLALFTLRPLRLMQLLKVLSCLRHFVYVKHIVKAVRQGAPLIATVTGLLAFVILFFAALSLSVFDRKPVYGVIGRCMAVQVMPALDAHLSCPLDISLPCADGRPFPTAERAGVRS